MVDLSNNFITSSGLVEIGDLWSKSIIDIAVDAGKKALDESTNNPDLIIIANMFSSLSSNQENLGYVITDALGLTGLPTFKIESGECSGAMACHVANNLLKKGTFDSIMVIGVEKMYDLLPPKIIEALSIGETYEFSQYFGITPSAINGLLARLYIDKYGISRDELSSVPVLCHQNSKNSSHSQFKNSISSEIVERSPMISDPLHLLDISAPADGAASVILSNVKTDSSVEILSSVNKTSEVFLSRENMLSFEATRNATSDALQQANVNLENIDLFEIHDNTSVNAALILENIGLSSPGNATRDIMSGKFSIESKQSISTSGGLKARGNPIGATGVYQIAECYDQLLGNSTQKSGANIALTHNMSGIDSNVVMHVLGGNS